MPLQCPNCRTVNRDTAAFCDRCGSPLTVPEERAAPVAGKPMDLPEESVEPGFTTPKSPAAPREPTMPSPAIPRPAGPSRERVSPETARPPKVKPGSPSKRHPWRWVFVFALAAAAVGGTALYLYVFEDSYDEGVILLAAAFCGGAAFILALPVALLREKRKMMGIVTHLQELSDADERRIWGRSNWVFDLRFTDSNWQPLRDRKGFLLPVMTVEFRSDRLSGGALEEGSCVVLRGRLRRGRVSARKIWNCSPGAGEPGRGEQAVFWGQVLGWQPRQAQDMRYPGHRYLEIWSFRLQRTEEGFGQFLRDGQGNLLPALAVEIRAQAISGSMQDGDRVEVRGQVMRGTLYAREVRNHSAGGAALVVKGWAGIP